MTCWSRHPEPLRARCGRSRGHGCCNASPQHARRGDENAELRGSLLALRSIARRVLQLTAEERELAREIETLTRKLAPQLLDQPGVGPHAAAQLVLSWSHKGRISTEAAFARLAGAAPIPASSGQTIRYRLDRRRPQTQPRTAQDPRHPQTHPPRHDRLHRTPTPRRQNTTRSKPLPQTLPRPQPLPATRKRSAASDLTDIEASLAQPRAPDPEGVQRVRDVELPADRPDESGPISR